MRLFTLDPAGYLGRALQLRLAEHGHTVVGPAKVRTIAEHMAVQRTRGAAWNRTGMDGC
jgi:nucleoside-diphosphate-sugar epimerase